MNDLTDEAWAELEKLREPTCDQLAIFASRSGFQTEILDDRLVLKDNSGVLWDPLNKLDQNHKLLGAVISIGDCKLFYDDGVDEFFIYKYTYGEEMGPPVAHRAKLNETVLEAAMNLWFPEKI